MTTFALSMPRRIAPRIALPVALLTSVGLTALLGPLIVAHDPVAQGLLHALEGPSLGLIMAAVAVWIASNHVPEIRDFLQRLPELGQGFVQSLDDLKGR